MGSEGTLLDAALAPAVRLAAAAFAVCVVFGLAGLLSLRGIWNAQPFKLLVGGVLCCFCFWIGAPYLFIETSKYIYEYIIIIHNTYCFIINDIL